MLPHHPLSLILYHIKITGHSFCFSCPCNLIWLLIAEYEKLVKQNRDEKMHQQEGADLNFLGNLWHVRKMEILSGIADMKDEFLSFLINFLHCNLRPISIQYHLCMCFTTIL
uniref:uncharacterized protein LOC122599001 isoform X2 n=1 Tax=Erigeron canadensis TaxID=72917 RepID=UPI001CB92B8A|nr:uncharacterized protein LOC122599001 isoform X2 [Erigeron canadensis]